MQIKITGLALLITLLALPMNDALGQNQPTGRAAESYPVPPEAKRIAGVPKGVVTQYHMAGSEIFPGTERDYWIYVPAQYDPKKPACLMVFNDGKNFASEKGASKLPIVFDNLIHTGEMPVTIGVFVNPGVMPALTPEAQPRYNRSFEYDGMGDNYARFLIEEVMPLVKAKYNISDDANDHAICGSSSGGIAAFTAAWERPDYFSRVYTIVGTYVGLRGGNKYPVLIRKTEPKALRVFLQDGSNDNDIYCGSWWVANQDMLSAFDYAGYEVNHVWGEGYHGQKHGAAIMPDVLRWLWKDYPKRVTTHYDQSRHEATEFLIDGEDWQLISEGHGFTEGPAVNANGDLYFTDLQNSKIIKITPNGKESVFAENTARTNGLAFGPDGKLYGAQTGKKRVVAWDTSSGKIQTIAEGIAPNDLVVKHDGTIYCTEPGKQTVWRIDPDGKKQAVDTGAKGCNGVVFSADQSLLYVTDYPGRFVYSYQIGADGSLHYKQQFVYLHVPANAPRANADGMCVDNEGWLITATAAGIQISDQPGRVHLILPPPGGGAAPSNATFGGPEGKTLYVTCGDKVFKRRINMQGAKAWQDPAKLLKPRL